jgi:hypothetical protein
MAGWERDLERWLMPFVAGLRRAEQRRWAPFRHGLSARGLRWALGLAPSWVGLLRHCLESVLAR